MSAAARLIQSMQLKPYQAVLVHKPANMRYLTGGFTGEGVVFISAARRAIVTDLRFVEQAERQCPGFEVIPVPEGIQRCDRWLPELCRTAGVGTLLYEDGYVSVREFSLLRHAADDLAVFLPLGSAIERLREVKQPEEIELIRRACRITDEAYTRVLPRIREGMTEHDLRAELEHLQLSLGAEGIAFPTIAAFGENGSLCHAVPGQRRLKKGDLITVDLGCTVGGYCSDLTRTLAFGEPDASMRSVFDTVRRAQEMCEAAVAPGVRGCDLDRMARDFIDSQGYAGRFGHALGHAVGLEIHEAPRLNQACSDRLLPGHVITVEPGVYLPGAGGVRIENTVLVTADGHEVLTNAPRDLIIL